MAASPSPHQLDNVYTNFDDSSLFSLSVGLSTLRHETS